MDSIEQIEFERVEPYIQASEREGMAGYSKNAIYYGCFINDSLVGFTSIQYYSNKAKFNNHYVLPGYRGNGYFRKMFVFSLEIVKARGIKLVEATCTKMSEKLYLEYGAEVVQQYKRYKKVHLHL